jgi:hypothetical protein
MKILDLPHFAQFKDCPKIKVLRHKDSKHDLWEFVQNGTFEEYQNEQSHDVFGAASIIISFIAERYNHSKFVGVWKVSSKRPKEKGKGFYYQTEEILGFDDLKRRLVVYWGDGARSWAQWLNRKGNKEVHQILPPNYVEDFPGFYDVRLEFSKLQQIINNPDSHREWKTMLSSVSGVYLILDKQTGNQYIGSAYGMGGIWGRWASYIKNPSGGNKLIAEVLRKYKDRYKDFCFSILRVLEPASTKEQVIDQETIIKNKLGSRAFGLNAN